MGPMHLSRIDGPEFVISDSQRVLATSDVDAVHRSVEKRATAASCRCGACSRYSDESLASTSPFRMCLARVPLIEPGSLSRIRLRVDWSSAMNDFVMACMINPL